ncbi:ADP-ribosylation factor family [Plasmodiophora brassicae]|uniref:Uncharacterized protein n=1 Tax=Plasmodiophora brassicae TaxID=37360 RepID=A0A3P3Y9C2_PLABS|nr:unnamed protein product [Plasmodiophora brassicae]
MSRGEQGAVPEVLLVGASASGKTLLVNRLKALCKPGTEVDYDPKPTVGVEFDQFTFDKSQFMVREVGSAMMSSWPSYTSSCCALLYAVNASDRCEVGNSVAGLMRCLRDLPSDTPLIIAFTHMDVPEIIPKWERHMLFRLDELEASTRPVTLLEISAMTGDGINTLAQTLSLTVTRIRVRRRRPQ